MVNDNEVDSLVPVVQVPKFSFPVDYHQIELLSKILEGVLKFFGKL
jgi:hypothetical protein